METEDPLSCWQQLPDTFPYPETEEDSLRSLTLFLQHLTSIALLFSHSRIDFSSVTVLYELDRLGAGHINGNL